MDERGSRGDTLNDNSSLRSVDQSGADIDGVGGRERRGGENRSQMRHVGSEESALERLLREEQESLTTVEKGSRPSRNNYVRRSSFDEVPRVPSLKRVIVGAVLVLVFLVTVSIIPTYNKLLQNGIRPYNTTDSVCPTPLLPTSVNATTAPPNPCDIPCGIDYAVRPFALPLTLSALQLGGVCVGLLIWNVVLKVHNAIRRRSNPFVDEASWVFGRDFLYKCKYTAPMGIFFGFKLGLTNWGLFLVTANVHLLMQSSSLFWIAVLSAVFLREFPSIWDIFACGLALSGALLMSFKIDQSLATTGGSVVLAMSVNLLSAVLEGCTVMTLRWASPILLPKLYTIDTDGKEMLDQQLNVNMSPSASLNDLRAARDEMDQNVFRRVWAKISRALELGVPNERQAENMTLMEVTLFKLTFSFLVNVVLMFTIEGAWYAQFQHCSPSWTAVAALNTNQWLYIFGGSFITLVFQSNVVALAAFALALTVGFVGQIKILPQVGFAELIPQTATFQPTTLHIVGVCCVFVSAVLYASLHICSSLDVQPKFLRRVPWFFQFKTHIGRHGPRRP